ncbi:GGDEF domain-containing protein [Pseudoalteromonas sp. T1lg23B]|uniref:GGDEF domain-containing protein n=1 Tax=Pseudoalteromonas sp. T1lg23B TaxID=2077097 RepID=UPI000CF71B48|nr:sensor domain-containing diguanylate cyclase [Pseudoalteromonas sp. T1lg23B]
MERRFYWQLGVLLSLTIIVNFALFYWNTVAVQKSEQLNTNWQQITSSNLEKAVLLAKLDQNLGYGGFIHHFKNYVLRREPSYLLGAQTDLSQVYDNIRAFRKLTLTDEEIAAIDIIESTVRTYASKLSEAQSEGYKELSVEQLDVLVRVNDDSAESAQQSLRASLRSSYQQALVLQTKLRNETLSTIKLGASVVSPIVCLAALLNIIALWRIAVLFRERDVLFEVTPDSILYCDKQGHIIRVNKAMEELFGYTKAQLLSMKVEDLIPESYRMRHINLRQDYSGKSKMRHGKKDGLNIVGLHKNGTQLPLDIAIASVNHGAKDFSIAIVRDIRQEEELAIKAERDYLTGVYNRRHAYSLLEDELIRANRYRRPLSLLLIDLDNFKPLNDQEGHFAGDVALKNLCQFLTESARPTDIIGRWGGDEFLIVCPETAHHSVMSFAQRLVKEFAEQAEHGLTLSIGVVAYDFVSDQLSANDCVDQADAALYRAKSRGRNQAVMFEAELLMTST